MPKSGLTFLLFYFSFVLLQAQPTGFTPVRDVQAFQQNFQQASNTISTIKSDFVQEKNLSMMEEKIVSKGQFFYKKEKKVRLEYSSPFKYLMIINGDNVLIQDENRSNKFSTKSNKMFRQINQIMVDCLSGAVLNNPDYTVASYESKTQYALALSPKSKFMKEYFNNIWIYVDKQSKAVLRVEMNEKSGDNTVMKFSNTLLNKVVRDDLFEK